MRAPVGVVLNKHVVGLVGELVVGRAHQHVDMAVEWLLGVLLALEDLREDVGLPVIEEALDVLGAERVEVALKTVTRGNLGFFVGLSEQEQRQHIFFDAMVFQHLLLPLFVQSCSQEDYILVDFLRSLLEGRVVTGVTAFDVGDQPQRRHAVLSHSIRVLGHQLHEFRVAVLLKPPDQLLGVALVYKRHGGIEAAAVNEARSS